MNELVRPILWIHADCLSPYGPTFIAYPQAPAIFVFDEPLLAAWQISLKRLTFIYECLLELPVTIRRGEVSSQIRSFADEQSANRIVTTESPSPRFHAIRAELQRHLPVETLPVAPLVTATGPLDLRRFSRYWQVAKRTAFGQQSMFE